MPFFSSGPSYDPATETPDLTGKVPLVTGGNQGIGYQTVKHLAKYGAKVYLACRNLERGRNAITKLQQELGDSPQIELIQMDVSSIRDVKRASDEFLEKEGRLDILVNNAAHGGTPERKVTEEGLEIILATNFLGHFALTTNLLPLLKNAAANGSAGSARIVNLSSEYHFAAPTLGTVASYKDLDVIHGDGVWPGAQRYGLSKMAAIWFTRELQRRLDEERAPIVVITVDPGSVATELPSGFFHNNFPWPLNKLATFISDLLFASPEVGSYPVTFSATSNRISDEPDKYKGVFITRPDKISVPTGQALDAELAKQVYVVAKNVVEDVLKNGALSQ